METHVTIEEKCRNGHFMTAANSRWRKGKRTCLTCELNKLEKQRETRARIKAASTVVLCMLLFLSGIYAFRQRAWALNLRERLVEISKDDVRIMHTLSFDEKLSLIRKLRTQQDDKIADWIGSHYLSTHETILVDDK